MQRLRSRSLSNNDTNVYKYYHHHHQFSDIPPCELVAVAEHEEATIDAHGTAPASPQGPDNFLPSQNKLDKQSELSLQPYSGHLEKQVEICILRVNKGDNLRQSNFAHKLFFFFCFYIRRTLKKATFSKTLKRKEKRLNSLYMYECSKDFPKHCEHKVLYTSTQTM